MDVDAIIEDCNQCIIIYIANRELKEYANQRIPLPARSLN